MMMMIPYLFFECKSLSFSFSLSVGNNFSFSVESRGKGALSSPTKKKKKKPTPSTVRQNARRREEFLRKKLAPAAEKSEQEVSEKEADSLGKAPTLQHHPSPSPSSERRKVITVGREKEVPTFSQLDGAPPVAAAKSPSYSSAVSSPASPPSPQTREVCTMTISPHPALS